MAQRIFCTCGTELTVNKNLGPSNNIPVVKQCPDCILNAYHYGWVDGDAAETEVTTSAAVLALMVTTHDI